MEIAAKKTLDGERDYLQVARTLRDKLDGLITSGATDLGIETKMLLDELDLVLADKAPHRHDEISTCTHSCCEHEQVLNHALWSTLPRELLQHVFADLPFSDICRLKSLSKEWQLSLQSPSSEFTLALKESSPRILGVVSVGGDSNFWLHVLDRRNNRWHALHVFVSGIPKYRSMIPTSVVEQWVHMNGATDAGLVCYVDKGFQTDLNRIYVINPMSGVANELPHVNLLTKSELTMMRIIVDRNTYHYKVIVVKRGPPVQALVYDSEVQQWTQPKPSLGRILGIAYNWIEHSYWKAYELGPCAYDCLDRKFHDFKPDQKDCFGKQMLSYALMKDRLFVLYWELREDAAVISEYCFAENATSWVKLETHKCIPQVFPQPSVRERTSRIHAWNGFLFVFQEVRLPFNADSDMLFNADSNTELRNGWVYDLATCEWYALPQVPWWSTIHLEPLLRNVICELHWNIQP